MHGKNWNRQRYCWMQDIIKIPYADYSIFTGVRAVLAKDGIDFKKHAGVIAYFQKEYIKQENLIKSILNIYRQLFKLETTVITVIFLLCQEKMQKNNISMH